jgi:molecular chaperone HtpG
LSEEHSKRILYSTDDVSQAGALNLWTAQGAEVLKLETVIDTQFIPWLEYRHEELKFQRVDAELDESLKEEDPELADQDGTTDSERLRS